MSRANLRVLHGALADIMFDIGRLDWIERELTGARAGGLNTKNLERDALGLRVTIEEDVRSACLSLGLAVTKLPEPEVEEAA